MGKGGHFGHSHGPAKPINGGGDGGGCCAHGGGGLTNGTHTLTTAPPPGDFSAQHLKREATRNEQRKVRAKLVAATVFAVVFMSIEIAGGILAGSLAIVTDAAHLFTDVANFITAILASKLSEHPASNKHSYGLVRAEVLSALINTGVIVILAAYLIYEGIRRIVAWFQGTAEPVDGFLMMVIAIIGVVFNIVLMVIFGHEHGHAHGGHDHGHGHSHGHSHAHGHSHGHSHSHDEEESGHHHHHDHDHNHDEEEEEEEDDDRSQLTHRSRYQSTSSHGSHASHASHSSHASGYHSHPHSRHNSHDSHHSHTHTHTHTHIASGTKSRTASASGKSRSNTSTSEKGGLLIEGAASAAIDAPIISTTYGSTSMPATDHYHHDHDHEEDDHDHDHLGNSSSKLKGGGKKTTTKKKKKSTKKHRNINLEAAHLHVITDLVQSIGVALAGVLIYFKPHWQVVDPICTIAFSILICYSVINMLSKSTHILLQGVPDGVDPDKLHDQLCAIKGVTDVHDLHIWMLSVGHPVGTVHMKAADPEVAMKQAQAVFTKAGIDHITIQMQRDECLPNECAHPCVSVACVSTAVEKSGNSPPGGCTYL